MKLVEEFLKMYISSQRLYEMGQVGRFSSIVLIVRNDEGQIPHFHFIKKQAKKNKEGCVCLETAEYFIHPGKTATLSGSERDLLIEFLQSTEPFSKKTYYEKLCDKWNELNRDNKDAKLIENIPAMPNYKKGL